MGIVLNGDVWLVQKNVKVLVLESSYEHQRARIFKSPTLKAMYELYLFFVNKIFVLPNLKKLADEADKLIVVGQNNYHDFRHPKVVFKNFKDYIDAEADILAFKKSTALARLWYKNKISELITYENLNLGEIVERQFLMFLNSLVKFSISMNELIKRENPNSIILEDEEVPTCVVAKAVSTVHHLRTSNLIPRQISEFKKMFKNFTLRWRSQMRKLKIKSKYTIPSTFTSQKNKILVVSLYPTNLQALFPLTKNLKGDNEILVVGSSREYFGQKDLEKENLNFKCVEDLCSDIDEANFMHVWKGLKDDKNFKNIFTCDGVPLWDAIKDELCYLFSIQFNELSRYITAIKKIIEIEKPSIILFFNDSRPIERIFIKLAKNYTIPTLLIQKTLYSRDYPLEFALTDKVAVDGNLSRKILIERGVDPQNIFVAGLIILDSLFGMVKKFDKESLFKKFKLDPNKKLVVFTSQPLLKEEGEKTFYSILNAFKKLPDCQLIVKLHPAENFDLPRNIAKDVGVEKNVLIAKDTNLHELLYCCDLVISAFSTTILDAFVLDKPVISLNFSKKPYPFPYDFIESGAAIGVFDTEELLPTINKAFSDSNLLRRLKQNRKKFLTRYHKVDGKTSERIVRLINSVMQAHPKTS